MSTHQPNDWNYPTQVRFGAGRVAELAAACTATGMRNPLLVMDAGLATGAVATAVRAGLGGLVQTAYQDFRSNPTGEDVARGVAQLRRGGHDGVVAVGGGSALDTGKAIAFMAVQQRPLWDFEDVGDNWRLAETDGIPPIIAVPAPRWDAPACSTANRMTPSASSSTRRCCRGSPYSTRNSPWACRRP